MSATLRGERYYTTIAGGIYWGSGRTRLRTLAWCHLALLATAAGTRFARFLADYWVINRCILAKGNSGFDIPDNFRNGSNEPVVGKNGSCILQKLTPTNCSQIFYTGLGLKALTKSSWHRAGVLNGPRKRPYMRKQNIWNMQICKICSTKYASLRRGEVLKCDILFDLRPRIRLGPVWF